MGTKTADQTLPNSPVQKILGIGGPKLGEFVVKVMLADKQTAVIRIVPGELISCTLQGGQQ